MAIKNAGEKFSFIAGAALLHLSMNAAASPIDPVAVLWQKTETLAYPLDGVKIGSPLDDTEQVDIVVSLKLRNRNLLDELIPAFTSPGNPSFGQWLTSEQAVSNFLPTFDQVERVTNYLKDNGFTNVRVSSNRLLINASASAKSIRTAFNTGITHASRGKAEGIVATRDVMIPAEISDVVLSVLGLQTLDLAQTQHATAQMVPVGTPSINYYPDQFQYYYGAGGLAAATNANVGIITWGSMTQTISDLHTFEAVRGLPVLNPAVVTVGTASPANSYDEWDLDSQVIQGMAGGSLAQLTFYSAHSAADADLTSAYNAALSGTATIINVSIGICETTAHNDGSMAADDQIFQMAVAQGKTFAASTGDHGSKECPYGLGSGAGTVVGAEYPASSSYVIAVGGTTLYYNSGTYGGEAAWSLGGGSPSLYSARPAWQTTSTSTKRGVPDVAFDANPSSGALIFLNNTQASVTYGGTSLSAPLFVGAWARIQSAYGPQIGFPASYLYGYAAHTSNIFNDVTTGSNGDYSATTGWDYATGLGSFNTSQLLAAFYAPIPGTPGPITPAFQTIPNASVFSASWGAASGTIARYELYKQMDSSGGTGPQGLVYSGPATSFAGAIAAGQQSTDYDIRVRACNASGCSAFTADAYVSICQNGSCP